MKIGNNDYKTILLDTNAIREIVTNENNSGKGFLENFMASGKYVPCISLNNVIELKPYADLYDKFIDYFSLMPCFILYPVRSILAKELNSVQNTTEFVIDNSIANAFSPLGKDDTFNCRSFFDKLTKNQKLTAIITQEIQELPQIATIWENQRKEALELLSQNGYPNNMIDIKFFKFQEENTILKDLKNWGISISPNINYKKFPAARIMAFSQFNRVHLTKKTIKPNDVMDTIISAIVPYVDAVVTENYQANVYKTAKSFIPEMKPLEIYTLKDIRIF